MVAEDDVAAWRRIAPSIVVQEFRDSARNFGQGDEAQFLYFILKGVVKLSHVTEKGGQLTISVLGPGSLFGCVSPGTVSEHAATAIGEVRAVRIAHPDMRCLVEKSAAFAALLNAELEASRGRMERKLISILTKTVEARLVETLCDLAMTFGAPCPHGYSLEIRLTQQDIADLVHASRPMVAKVMNALRRRGALDYKRDMICVNHAALRSSAAI